MTWVDAVIAGIPLVAGLFGLFHGFVRQAASWAGLVLGYLAGARYYAAARDALGLRLPAGNDAAAFAAVFVGVYVAARLVGLLLERWVRGSRLSGAERLAGAAAGIVKGALLAVLFVVVLALVVPKGYEPLARSRYAPCALSAGKALSRVLPAAIGDAVRDADRRVADQLKNRPRK